MASNEEYDLAVRNVAERHGNPLIVAQDKAFHMLDDTAEVRGVLQGLVHSDHGGHDIVPDEA